MATATETRTETKATRRGFPGIACLECGEADAVQVGLEDMGFACTSCGEEFQASDVRDMLASWPASWTGSPRRPREVIAK